MTLGDDGKTGTDTGCEDFQRLLSDVYSGRINCVIVKDMSRLSRNYTDTGNLIENLFVRLNVRFISLAEGVNSYCNPRQHIKHYCSDEKVQSLLKRDTRTTPKEKQLYLFNGFLKCADCGWAMSRIASKSIYVYYQCGTYKSLSKKPCTMHSIKSDRLEAEVLFAISQQVHLTVTYSEFAARINAVPLKKSKLKRLEDSVTSKHFIKTGKMGR